MTYFPLKQSSTLFRCIILSDSLLHSLSFQRSHLSGFYLGRFWWAWAYCRG